MISRKGTHTCSWEPLNSDKISKDPVVMPTASPCLLVFFVHMPSAELVLAARDLLPAVLPMSALFPQGEVSTPLDVTIMGPCMLAYMLE